MLVILSFILGIGFFFLGVFLAGKSFEGWSLFTGTLGVCALIVFIISLGVMAANYIGISADIAAEQVRYDSLIEQAENGYYENDNDVGKKELANQIQAWNEDLAKYQNLQRDFWIGILIPNIYDQFKPIPMNLLRE